MQGKSGLACQSVQVAASQASLELPDQDHAAPGAGMDKHWQSLQAQAHADCPYVLFASLAYESPKYGFKGIFSALAGTCILKGVWYSLHLSEAPSSILNLDVLDAAARYAVWLYLCHLKPRRGPFTKHKLYWPTINAVQCSQTGIAMLLRILESAGDVSIAGPRRYGVHMDIATLHRHCH